MTTQESLKNKIEEAHIVFVANNLSTLADILNAIRDWNFEKPQLKDKLNTLRYIIHITIQFKEENLDTANINLLFKRLQENF